MQATSRPSWAYSTLIIIATIASFSHECCCCPCLVIKFVVVVRKSNPSRGSERRLRRLQTIVFHCRLYKNATQYRRDVWVRIALKLAFLSAFYFSNQGVDQGSDNIGLSPALNCLKPLACSPNCVLVLGIPLEHHRAGREQRHSHIRRGLPSAATRARRPRRVRSQVQSCRSCRGSRPPLGTPL